MKKVLNNIALVFALLIAFSSIGAAQNINHLREVSVTDFDKIQVSLDTEVIILKSKRNQVTLVGDSAYIASLPVLVEDRKLEFSYAEEPDSLLRKVLIEYINLDHATTGGTGTYYFHKINEDRLVVFNPYANVVLNGDTNHIRVVSQEGVTDVTTLKTKVEAMYIGDTALLVVNEAN